MDTFEYSSGAWDAGVKSKMSLAREGLDTWDGGSSFRTGGDNMIVWVSAGGPELVARSSSQSRCCNGSIGHTY